MDGGVEIGSSGQRRGFRERNRPEANNFRFEGLGADRHHDCRSPNQAPGRAAVVAASGVRPATAPGLSAMMLSAMMLSEVLLEVVLSEEELLSLSGSPPSAGLDVADVVVDVDAGRTGVALSAD